MCERGNMIAVPAPDWSDRINRVIALDECIADVVVALWGHDVVTLGSCCGHGAQPASLVLNNDRGTPAKARAALGEVDPGRQWQLLQWQLVDVTDVPLVGRAAAELRELASLHTPGSVSEALEEIADMLDPPATLRLVSR